jgi:HTH-type transcriptional regulator / antitoxin HigA
MSTYSFEPDYAVPPGESLQETLDVIGMTQAELAQRTGLTPKTINLIIKGTAPITPGTALQLERVLGTPASFWNNLEQRFRESLARADEARRLESAVAWLAEVPYRAMAKLSWVRLSSSKVDQVRELLDFFGVASVEQWRDVWLSPNAVFRASLAHEKDPGAVAAWLRKGELVGRGLETKPYDAAAFKASLDVARSLTREVPSVFQPALVASCAAAGVAVAFVPELPRLRASGATRWLSPTKALIQLSLRYKSDDQLWFTFFHEAGHILLHGKRDSFLEGVRDDGEEEAEANRFAADRLIPPAELRRFAPGKRLFTKVELRAFAVAIGVAPGIVVGRLQHDGLLPRTHCNDLKRHLEWAS